MKLLAYLNEIAQQGIAGSFDWDPVKNGMRVTLHKYDNSYGWFNDDVVWRVFVFIQADKATDEDYMLQVLQEAVNANIILEEPFDED